MLFQCERALFHYYLLVKKSFKLLSRDPVIVTLKNCFAFVFQKKSAFRIFSVLFPHFSPKIQVVCS